MELGAIRRFAIVVVECEAESFAEPRDGLAYVGIDDVGEYGVWGNGAIFNHQSTFERVGGRWNGNENRVFSRRKKDNAETQSALRPVEKR